MKKNFNNATEALNFSAKVRKTIENARTRSAWDRGVQAYALELLDDYDEYVRYAAHLGSGKPSFSGIRTDGRKVPGRMRRSSRNGPSEPPPSRMPVSPETPLR